MAEVFKPTFGDPHYAERERLLKGFKTSSDPFLQGVYRFSVKHRHHPMVVKETIHAVTLGRSEAMNSPNYQESSMIGDQQEQIHRDAGALLPDQVEATKILSFPNKTGDIASVGAETHTQVGQTLASPGSIS